MTSGVGPRVSVLLPARDAAATLGEALDSLSAQTLPDWECLVVDDGSVDDTLAIARDRAGRDSRIRVLRRERPGGIVAALTLAAAEARADRFARQDADDRSHAARLERCLVLLESDARLGAVACAVDPFPTTAVRDGMRAYCDWLNGLLTPEQIERDLWVESPLPHPAVLMRRDAFLAAGGYREDDGPEDYDLWLRMHAAGWLFAKTAELLYEWRHRPGRLTFSDARYSVEAFLACKLRHLEPRLRQRPCVVWGAGRDGKRLVRALLARGITPEAFVDIDPRKISRTRSGLPVWAPEALAARATAPDGPPLVLAAVGTRGARALIRARLQAMAWNEPRDLICLH